MNFLEVAVSSTKYHGMVPLTYASDTPVANGAVVEVPLRSASSLGVVIGRGRADPKFKAKPIQQVFLMQLPTVQLELLSWMQAYYPAPLSTIAQLFLPSKITESSQETTPPAPHRAGMLPRLTHEQQAALQTLTTTKSTTALLHGDTGTGKTRVYLELARQTIAKGQSVTILVPEIGLTPQMEQTFTDQFSGRVQTIHSGMTDKARRETWQRIMTATEPQIIIGPRSALFMPVNNLGLIVVDEAHDKGYKQDQLPYYDATRVAAKLASLAGCLCVYGTATPRLADYWHLVQNHTPIVRLAQQIHADIKQPIHTIIDAGQRDNFPRSAIFSDAMLAALTETLAQGEQSLVFLNRRGTARFVSCSQCGWHAACLICDTPLTYHGDAHQLRCHTCGTKQSVPTVCPECGSAELRYQRRGTKALQSELGKFFPQARIARFDSDNTKDETLAAQYQQLADGNIDIIIGTQVIAKGLDLANLSLVCIPQADLSTYLPDFTADEQTFQLLRQVLGRVGRTDKASRVILQTYAPDSAIIQAALANDWQSFYDQQLVHRKKYNFPPFAYLLQLTTLKASPESARAAGEKLKTAIEKALPDCQVLGPAPRFHEKVQGKYQWQLIVKAPQRQRLMTIIKQLPSGWRYNIDPSDLL